MTYKSIYKLVNFIVRDYYIILSEGIFIKNLHSLISFLKSYLKERTIEVHTKVFPFETQTKFLKKTLDQQTDEQMENEFVKQNELKYFRDEENSVSSGESEQAEDPLLNNGAPLVAIDTFSSKINDVIDELNSVII